MIRDILPCSAKEQHGNRHFAYSPIDGVLNDNVIIRHCLNALSKPVMEKDRARFDKLCA